jgi:hypothetical protein
MELVSLINNLRMEFQIGINIYYKRPSTPIKNVICNTYAEE